MALKITLKPQEKIYINGALIANGDHPAQIFLENKVRLLREKEIMTIDRAQTVCEKIYLAVQMMYFEPEGIKSLHKTYWDLVRALTIAAPSTTMLVHEISEKILIEEYYAALKLTRNLIEYENQLMNNAQTTL